MAVNVLTSNNITSVYLFFPRSDTVSLIQHSGLRESLGPSETPRHLYRDLNSGPSPFQRLPATYLNQTCEKERALRAAEMDCVNGNEHHSVQQWIIFLFRQPSVYGQASYLRVHF